MKRLLTYCTGIQLIVCILIPSTTFSQVQSARRDPFVPYQSIVCHQSSSIDYNDALAQLKTWQLYGLIGQGDDWIAWLRLPSGQWYSLHNQQTIIDGYWRVIKVSPQGVQFVAENLLACSDNQVILLSLQSKNEVSNATIID